MASKTTFFSIRVPGPFVPWSAVPKTPDHPDYPRLVRLAERARAYVHGHRYGVWSVGALVRLAQRQGCELSTAYIMTYDKGHYITNTERRIYG